MLMSEISHSDSILIDYCELCASSKMALTNDKRATDLKMIRYCTDSDTGLNSLDW